ncbi:MAG: transposase [Paeniglutamicibacter sp.]
MDFGRRNYRFRVYPTPEQAAALERQGHAARALWNLIHGAWQANGFRVGLDWYTREIKTIRKDEDYGWFADLPAQAAQSVWKNYFKAWTNCWDPGHPAQAPTFKKRHAKMGIDIPQARDLKPTRVNNKYITVNVPLAGKLKVRLHRKVDFTAVTGARLVRDGLGWHLIFRTRTGPIARPTAHKRAAIGIDRGVVVPLALSDGTNFEHPDFLTGTEAKSLLRLERQLARQEARRRATSARTSNRQRRTQASISALRNRQARRRKDFLDKTSRKIATDYSLIVLEDLDISNMTTRAKPKPDPENPGSWLPNHAAAKTGLNKSILNEGWGDFHRMVAYKAAEHGGTVITVNARYTSQTCATCRIIGNRESQADFRCTNTTCSMFGIDVNADTNAAQEIETRGTELASSGMTVATAGPAPTTVPIPPAEVRAEAHTSAGGQFTMTPNPSSRCTTNSRCWPTT